MRTEVRGLLRRARYALPSQIDKLTDGPGPQAAARICGRLHRQGLAATVGHFPGRHDTAESIAAANLAVAARLSDGAGGGPSGAYLSVKAPPLGFDAARLHTLAEAVAAWGGSLMFDAHGPQHTDRTHTLFRDILADFSGTGCVLPARWPRSRKDAAWLRDSSARLRIVKGEWADPDGDEADVEAGYLALIRELAGRRAMVAVATHSPDLAERALAVLLDAGTPCELEQLRGLPARRTTAIARRLKVPVRVYVPFGAGWLPYAADKALARPYLLAWMVKDRFGARR
jgi:proline dehydrogenase